MACSLIPHSINWAEYSVIFLSINHLFPQAANIMRCDTCGGKHRRVPVDRPFYSARFCEGCRTHHQAKEVKAARLTVPNNDLSYVQAVQISCIWYIANLKIITFEPMHFLEFHLREIYMKCSQFASKILLYLRT